MHRLLSKLLLPTFVMTALSGAPAAHEQGPDAARDGVRFLRCGALAPGELEAAGQLQTRYFRGSAGQVIDIALVKTAGFASSTPRGNVLAPSGTPLNGGFNADTLQTLTLPETGIYTMQVRADDFEGLGTYNLGFECVTPLGHQQAALTCGDLWEGEILEPGQVDFYTFQGVMNDVVDLTLAGTGNTGFVPFPPPPVLPTENLRARVFAPSGVVVATFDSGNLETLILPETGQYAVRVRTTDMGDIGPYNLGLECRSPANPVVAQLQCGELWTEQITEPGEVDLYTFVGVPGDIVEPTLVETAGFVNSVPRMSIFAPSGADLGSFNANTLAPIVVTEAGTHTIRVSADTLASTGRYNLALNCRPPASSAISLGCSSSETALLPEAGAVAYYTFDATTGDVNDLTLTVLSGLANSARFRLFSPSGVDLGAFQAGPTHALSQSETGTYVVRVHATNLVDDGTFSFDRVCQGPAPAPVHLGCGALANRSITIGGQADDFSFYGSNGDMIDLTLTSSGFTALGRLFSPSGVELAVFNANTLNEFLLAETGLYTVRVTANNLVSTGSYWLGLECRLPLGPVEARLVCGDIVAETIAGPSEVDYFNLEASAGATVDLTLTSSGFTAFGRLFSPTGVDLGAFNANTLNEFVLQETGAYAVRVTANTLVHTGSYWLGFECRLPAGPVEAHLICGDIATETITGPSELDYFTFSGSSGDLIDLTLTSSGFTAFGRLFSPSGADLGAFNANTLNKFLLQETGLYVVRVTANTLVHTGSYWLGFDCSQPLGPVKAQLTCGSVAAEAINSPSELDYFTFSGSSGDLIDLTLTSSGFTALGRLFSPSGADLGAFSANTLNEFALQETGQYAVRVTANTLVHTGSYWLGFECRLPLGPATPLVCGGIAAEMINGPSEVDWFTFSGSSGDLIDLTLTSSGFTALGRLFSPSGTDLGAFSANTLNEFALQETGQYAVRVTANTLVHTGSYWLGFECRLPLGPATPLVCGDIVAEMINGPSEVDWFTFDGSNGDMIDLTLTSSGFTALGRLFSPSGADLGAFSANTLNEFALQETGQYAVRVTANTLVHTGSYWLGLECRLPLGPATPLVCGGIAAEMINGPSEVDWFTFDGSNGDMVELTLTSSGFTACARVFSPTGADLGSFCANSLKALSLTETGTYSVRIHANTLVSTGSYSLGLNCL